MIRDEVVAIAHRYADEVHAEDPPGSNCNDITAWAGLGCCSWCHIGASKIDVDAGDPFPVTYDWGAAWAPSGVEAFKSVGLWRGRLEDFADPRPWGTPFADVRPGDYWYNDQDPYNQRQGSDAYHVGRVVGVERGEDGMLLAVTNVEGNWGSQVSLVRRPIDEYTLGFGLRVFKDEVKRGQSPPLPEPAPPVLASPVPSPETGVPAPAAPPFPGVYLVLASPDLMGADPGLPAVTQAVRDVQIELLHRNYDIGPWGADGEYGPATAAAVAAFQEAHALAGSIRADGHGDAEVGPETWDALYTAPVLG